MKHNWEYKPFKQLSDILYGCPFESEFFNSESKGMPLIRIRDVKPGYTSTYFNGGYSDDYIIKKGDYLIGMDGEFNIAPWQSEDALLNQRVCRVKSINENVILSNFIYYFLGKELKDIEAQTSFVTVKHLSAKVLNAINTPVPPMEVQEQIVAELDTINETIEDCRELLRNLDALSQSLFYDFFGDPVTNPKGWEIKKLDEICRAISTGITYKPDNVADIGTIVLRSSNIQNSSFVLDDIVHIDMSLKPSQYVQKNDILMCSRNGSARLVGKVALIPQLNEKMSWGAFMTIIRSDYYHYLFQFFRLPAFREQLTKTKTTTVNQITIGMLKKIQIPMPPLSLQEQFASRIEQIEAQKKAVEETIENLQTLLDSRMDYWFN